MPAASAPHDTYVSSRRVRAKALSSPTGRSMLPRSTTSWWPRRLQESRGRTGECGDRRRDGREGHGWYVGSRRLLSHIHPTLKGLGQETVPRGGCSPTFFEHL